MFIIYINDGSVEWHACLLVSLEGCDWRPRAASQLLRLTIPINSLTFDVGSKQWRVASVARAQLDDWLEFVVGHLQGQVIREHGPKQPPALALYRISDVAT